jgi:hypothetical protein
MVLNEAQQKSIAIVPKFSAVLGIIGSSLIIMEVLYLDRSKLKRVYHRLLLAMSVYDMFAAFAYFISTWPTPIGTENVAFASGTTQTCVWQGFVIQFGVISTLTYMCVAIYFLLVISYSWKEEDIRKWAEPCFYILPLTVALVTTSTSVALDLFNNANQWCWIAPFPKDCNQSYNSGGETNCERGDNAEIYRFAFYYGWVWFAILVATIAMLGLYITFWRLERANAKYGARQMLATGETSAASSTPRQQRPPTKASKSRQVAMQGVWFVGAFYVALLPGTLNRLVQLVFDKSVFVLSVLHCIFGPARGMWNFLVYIRPRYLKYRESNPQAGFIKAMKAVVYDDYRKYAHDDAHDRDQDVDGARDELALWRRKLRSIVTRATASETHGGQATDEEIPEGFPEEEENDPTVP